MFGNTLFCLDSYSPEEYLLGCILPLQLCGAKEIVPMIKPADQPIPLLPGFPQASTEAGADLGASDR